MTGTIARVANFPAFPTNPGGTTGEWKFGRETIWSSKDVVTSAYAPHNVPCCFCVTCPALRSQVNISAHAVLCVEVCSTLFHQCPPSSHPIPRLDRFAFPYSLTNPPAAGESLRKHRSVSQRGDLQRCRRPIRDALPRTPHMTNPIIRPFLGMALIFAALRLSPLPVIPR